MTSAHPDSKPSPEPSCPIGTLSLTKVGVPRQPPRPCTEVPQPQRPGHPPQRCSRSHRTPGEQRHPRGHLGTEERRLWSHAHNAQGEERPASPEGGASPPASWGPMALSRPPSVPASLRKQRLRWRTSLFPVKCGETVPRAQWRGGEATGTLEADVRWPPVPATMPSARALPVGQQGRMPRSWQPRARPCGDHVNRARGPSRLLLPQRSSGLEISPGDQGGLGSVALGQPGAPVSTLCPQATFRGPPPPPCPGLTAEQLHEAHVPAGVESQGVGRDAEGLEDGRVGNAPHGQAALQAHGPRFLLAEAAVPQRQDVGQGHVLLPRQAAAETGLGTGPGRLRAPSPGKARHPHVETDSGEADSTRRRFTLRQKRGCRRRLFKEKQQTQNVTQPTVPRMPEATEYLAK